MSASTIAHNPEQSAPPHLETSPIQFKAILAATDFSDQATTALKVAAQMAKLFHSRLQVVYAVIPEFSMADTTMLSSELQKIGVERGQEELHQYTRKIPEVRSIKHQEIALCGVPTEVIAALVETAGIDLIVMGSHGRGTAGKMVLGSVAESVIRSTHCPVLVTGPHCEPHSWPLKSIVLATDLPATSLRAAQYATSFTQQFSSTLSMIHVLREHAGEAATSGSTEENLARNDLHELAPDDPEFRKHVHFTVRSGDAAQEILRIAKHNKADLIIMGAHEHTALADHAPWATLSKVLREAVCPVLAVQPHIA
jgi:nucleotide-binding universal stress UspA family protein